MENILNDSQNVLEIKRQEKDTCLRLYEEAKVKYEDHRNELHTKMLEIDPGLEDYLQLNQDDLSDDVKSRIHYVKWKVYGYDREEEQPAELALIKMIIVDKEYACEQLLETKYKYADVMHKLSELNVYLLTIKCELDLDEDTDLEVILGKIQQYQNPSSLGEMLDAYQIASAAKGLDIDQEEINQMLANSSPEHFALQELLLQSHTYFMQESETKSKRLEIIYEILDIEPDADLSTVTAKLYEWKNNQQSESPPPGRWTDLKSKVSRSYATIKSTISNLIWEEKKLPPQEDK